MARAVNRGYFEWDFFNPFQPRRELVATFFPFSHEDQAIKVILEPLDRNINHWEFSVTLEFLSGFNRWSPKNIVINIKRDVCFVTRKEVANVHVTNDNRFIYRFQDKVEMIPEAHTQHFQIKIEFDLEDYEPRRNIYIFNEVDLEYLSKAMLKILQNEGDKMNPNMVVWSENNKEGYRVHSYIIYWRWNSLFRQHPGKGDIHTNISGHVLKHILVYMYSGLLKTFRSPKSRTELCQVIDRYKIPHLYRVLVKNEVKQQRVTENSAYVEAHLFRLETAESRTNPSFVWEFNPKHGPESEDNEHSVTLRIQLRNETNNWISYSLQSRSTGQIFVEVNMEVVKTSRRDIRFVGQDYILEPDQSVDSGPIRRPKNFTGPLRDTFLRCFLCVSTGKKVEMIRSVDTEAYQYHIERFKVLSNHMHKLNEVRRLAQMQVRSREIPGERQIYKAMHQEVLRARVPQWWHGFSDADPDRMPNFTVCILGGVAMPIVFDYIYTAKLPLINRRCIDEIENFAAVTEFQALSKWVTRYRNMKNE